MYRQTVPGLRRAALCASLLACLLSGGCAAVMVGSAAVGVVTTGAGLAVDAAVGTVKLGGKAVGAVIGTGASERDGK